METVFISGMNSGIHHQAATCQHSGRKWERKDPMKVEIRVEWNERMQTQMRANQFIDFIIMLLNMLISFELV